MPIYEFRCEACERLFEQILPINHRRTHRCPGCGKRAQRVMSRSSFQLKGTGWYATDYRPARKPAGESSKDKGAGDGTSSAASG
jgi:putative FmdB family regulatory protein